MKEHASFNRCYRLLWSGTTAQWKPVPETARTAKKGGRGKAANTLTLAGVLPGVAMSLFVMSNLAAQPPPAPPTAPAITQLPTGGNVVGGQATISQSAIATAANMVVNQTSQRAIIDWRSFNLGAAATVQFVQPNAQSVILNRVLDPNPTQVFGRINANGQVFLTNPYGVYFAPTATVDVGGLVATTYNIRNEDFMSGFYRFERSGSTGSVVNEGALRANAGGYIALLAPEVQNSGLVLARAGTVAFAAGEQVTLTLADGKGLSGITTTASAIASLIDNRLAVQAPDGQIILSAVALNKLQAGVIKNSGSLQATSLSTRGGKIVLEADEIELTATATIDVSGRSGGGNVLMGGDWQGSGSLRQATKVNMANGATINANATDSGDGGKVVLWSNVSDANSTTTVGGSIYANAGPNGGNGGQIETSGHHLNVEDAQVSTQAPQGKIGEWLLDPANVNIVNGGNLNSTESGGTYTPSATANTSNISNVTLSNALANTSVTVTTSGSSANSLGDINIAANISWGSASVLTLNANNSIFGNGNISITGGGSVVFNTTNTTSTSGYFGVISGNGSVTKQGLGIFILSSNNTYSGGTTVSAGTLKDAQNNTTATLDGNGDYTFSSSGVGTGAVRVLDGGTLTFGGNVNLANYLELQGAGASGQTGALALGMNTVVYGKTLLKASGTVIGGGAAATEGRISGDILDGGLGLGLTLNSSAGSVSLYDSKSYFGTTKIFGTSSLNTSSNATSATFNTSFDISSGGVLQVSTPMATGIDINITGDINGAGNLTLARSSVSTQTTLTLMGKLNLTGTTNVTNASLVLKNNSNYTIASQLTGIGNVTQAGSGNLTLTANSTGFTGNLSINAGGTVTLGDGSTSGIVNANIANNGSLNFNRTTNVTAPGVISGTGPLNKLGTNVLNLSGNNTFTGNITVGAGTLKAGFAGSSTYGAFGNQTNITLTDLSGVGLDISGFSTAIGSLTGGTNNTLNLGASSLSTGLNGLSTTYAGKVLGSGTLSKSGAGTFNLSGNSSSFTGGLVVSAGSLVLTNTTVIGSGTQLINVSGSTGMLELQNISNFSNPVYLNASGATLNISDGNTTMVGNLTFGVSGNISIGPNSSLTTTGNLNASSYAVSKYGLGTWIVAEPTVSTPTQSIALLNVNAGRMELNSTKWKLGGSTHTIAANATLSFGAFSNTSYVLGSNSGGGNITDNGLLQIAPTSTSASDFYANVSGTGSVEYKGTGQTNVTGTQFYNGTTTIFPNASVRVNDLNSHLGNISQALINNGDLTITSGNSQDWVQSITGSGNVTFDAADTIGFVVVRPLGMKAANSYTGTTTLTNRVQLNLGGQTSCTTNASLGTGDIIFQGTNSTLYITRTSDITLTNNMSGLGKISLNRANVTTTLAGNVNIGGNITMNGSNTTLVIAPTGSLGANGVFASSIIFNTSNTTLEYASASDVCITGNLSGGYGSLRKTTSNSDLTLTGNNNINGGVWIEAGAVYALGTNTSSGQLGSGNISNNATLVFNHTDTGNLSLGSLAGNITGTGNVTFISVGNISIDKTINLSGTNSLIKIQSNGNVTMNSSLTSSGSNGKIILAAGAATAAGNATGGQIAINNTVNVTLNNSGSLVMFQGNNSANLTATMDARVMGANTTNVPKYKTYNASLGNVTSAVTGTRNYFYRVQPTATVNGGTVTATKVYDGTTTANPSYTGGGSVTGVDGDTLTGCVTGASYNTSSAGNKSLTYNVALASNNSAWVVTGYAGTVNPTSTVANITQAPLVIQANDAADFVTLSAASGAFAGVSYSGFVNNENTTTAGLTGTLNISRPAGNSAGTYALTPSGLSANNYRITYRTGTYTIVPAQKLIVRVNDGTSVYGDASTFNVTSVSYLMPDNVTITNLTPSLTLSNGIYSVNDGVGGTASFKLGLSNATLSGSNNTVVGLWNVGYNNLSTGGGNFNGVTVAGTQTITKRDLNITFAADNKVYDGNTQATFNLTTNRIAGDALTLSTDALGAFANKNAANGTAVTLGNITIAGADMGNYNLLNNTVSTTANITPKSLALSGLTVSNKVYDATTTAFVSSFGSLNGLVGFDDVQLNTSAALGVFSDKNVANNKNVTVSGVLLNGLDANNYLVSNATTIANITAKALTVSGLSVATSKVYDGTNLAAPLGMANLQATSAAGTGTGVDGKPYSGDGITVTGTPVGTYNSKDVATAANVSITGLSLSGNTNGNYVLTAPTPLAATITPKDLTIKVNDDAQFFTITSDTSGFNGVSYKGFVTGESNANLTFSNISAPGMPNITTSLNATQKGTPGMYANALTLNSTATNSNYNITVQTGNFSVVGADQLLVRVNNVNTTYGDTANLVVGSAQYVYNGSALYNLTVNTLGNLVTVDDGLGSGGGATMMLSPTVLASQRSASNNTAVGIYNIEATGLQKFNGANFNNTVVVVGMQTVTAKALTATATAADKVYDGNTTVSVNLTSSNVIANDNISYVFTDAYFSDKNAGNNKSVRVSNISLNGTDAGNYIIQNVVANATANILQKALTITGITASNKVYDGNTSAVVNVSAVNSTSLVGMGMLSGDNLTVSATGVFTDKNAGTGKIVNLSSNYSGADAGNYNITSQTNALANIAQKALSITGITADNKAYDGNTSAVMNISAITNATLVTGGMIAGDSLTVSAMGVFNNKNVGNGKTVNITGNYTGGDVDNYLITSQANTSANITQKSLTITGITADNKVYDGNTTAVINASSVSNASLVSMGMVTGDNLTVSATGLFVDKNAGTNKTVALTSNYSGGDMGNYLITSQANTSANITQKSLTISGITADNKIYDGNNISAVNVSGVNNTSLVSMGMISGDNLTVSATGVFGNKNVGANKNVNLTSAYTGADVGNYNITSQVNTTADITTKPITISGITAANKVYDGNNISAVNVSGVNNTSLVSMGMISGDNLTVSATGVFGNKNVGANKNVNLTSAYTGADVGNYNITSQASTTADITQKSLTISGITAHNKIYDGNTAAVINTSGVTNATLVTAGMIAGDNLTVSATGVFDSKNVGTGKTVNLTSAYTGADVGNYNITSQASTTADIAQKSLTITGITAANKIYDGTTAAVVNTSGVTNATLLIAGMIAGDELMVAATGSFADKNAGTGKTVTLRSSYGGADVANYNITSQTSTTADITGEAKINQPTPDSAVVANLIVPPPAPISAPISQPKPVEMPPARVEPSPLIDANTAAVSTLSTLSGVQIRALTSDQLRAIKSTELAQLMPVQLQAMTSDQLASFTAEQKTAFTPEQLAVMNTRQIAAVDLKSDLLTSQKALVLVTQTSVNTTATSTPIDKAALPLVAAAALATSSPIHVELNEAPTSQPTSTMTSGVLPVAVIGEGRTSNIGMAYEQQPNDIRVQLTSAPSTTQAPSTLVRFTGKFKTFIVSNERGEMVPYQGAMIGKRMVILADTEGAKSLARKEMQTVLAAAITSLGANQVLSFAQIESVVIDLR